MFRYKLEEENEFEVKRILNKNMSQYLIKWKGYDDSENIWKQKEDLANYKKKNPPIQIKKRAAATEGPENHT